MSDLVKLSVISLVKDGSWIFGSILPIFYKALASQKTQKIDHSCITSIALRYYLNMNVKIMDSAPCYLIPNSFDKVSDFRALGDLIYKNSNADVFSMSEKKIIEESLNQIEKLDSILFEQTTKVFKAYFRIRENRFRGASSPHAFGVYFAGDVFFQIGLEERCLSLIHELAHQELFLVQMLDRLVLEEKDQNLKFAPYQGVLRPPIGRLHSFWALFRMNQYVEIFNGDKIYYSKKVREAFDAIGSEELTQYANHLLSAAASYLKIDKVCG